MLNLSYKLAIKYLFTSYSEKNIGTMIKICSISIIISTFSLSLITAIMNGFEKGTRDKLQGIHSDLIIYSSNFLPLDYDKIDSMLKQDFGKYIEAIAPQASSQVLVQNLENKQDITNLVMLRGIDLEQESKVSNLKLKLFGKINNGEVIIGESLAKQLGVNIDDSINLLYPESGISTNKIQLQIVDVKVAGFFKVGISEFDEHLIFCSLDFFDTLFETGITEINIKVSPIIKYNATLLNKLILDLKTRLDLQVISWQDLYPALVSALAIEKYAMFLILLLVVLIASMNIISLLFMFIVQKRLDIAILKSLGMKNSQLVQIFVLIGVIISFISSIIGTILALFISFILNNYSLISLPDIYYITYLRADFELIFIPIIIILVTLIGLIASYIPARRISSLLVVNILKEL